MEDTRTEAQLEELATLARHLAVAKAMFGSHAMPERQFTAAGHVAECLHRWCQQEGVEFSAHLTHLEQVYERDLEGLARMTGDPVEQCRQQFPRTWWMQRHILDGAIRYE